MRVLVHGQDQCSLRRVHIQPHDVGQFAVEFRIAAELEGFDPMGLQSVLLPNAMHRGRRQADSFGQPARTPMRGGLRFAQRCAYYREFLGRGYLPRTPRAWSIAQAVQTPARVPSSPAPAECFASAATPLTASDPLR